MGLGVSHDYAWQVTTSAHSMWLVCVPPVEIISPKPLPSSTVPHVVLSSLCPGLGDRGGG